MVHAANQACAFLTSSRAVVFMVVGKSRCHLTAASLFGWDTS